MEVKNLVDPAAIALMVTAVLGILVQIANFLLRSMFSAYSMRQGNVPAFSLLSGAAGAGLSMIGILSGILIFYAGTKMRNLENHGLCVAASILAMVPCIGPCCILGLPAGIWCLVVLFKPEVKNAFH
jgi:hypothetical protein